MYYLQLAEKTLVPNFIKYSWYIKKDASCLETIIIITEWCRSPLVWTLINCEILVYFLWKTLTFCYRLIVLESYHIQAATKPDDSFLLGFCHFFMNWGHIIFLLFVEKNSSLNAWFKYKVTGLNHRKILPCDYWSCQSHGHLFAFVWIEICNGFCNYHL